MTTPSNPSLSVGLRARLQFLRRYENYDGGWAVVYAGQTTTFDGQPWINFRTVVALERLGLVEVEWDGEASRCRLTPTGREAARV